MEFDRRQALAVTGSAFAVVPVADLAGLAAPRTESLKTTFKDLLARIDQARAYGATGNRPFFVVSSGLAYVQGLALPPGAGVQLETVSTCSIPAIGRIMARGAERLLSELGFSPPTTGLPNYWQIVDVSRTEDLEHTAAKAAAVLGHVFMLRRDAEVVIKVCLPDVRAVHSLLPAGSAS